MKTIIGSEINTAAELLQKGEIIAIPTETVYGLAANALDADAVLKIYETKGRPLFNPLILHVSSANEFEKYAKNIPQLVYILAEKFCPGPITFVLPKKDIIPDIVTSGGDSVGLRVPEHLLTLELLSNLPFPLAAPSANSYGYISPVTAAHVYEQLNEKIPYILDGGTSSVGLESTVVSVSENSIDVLRLGGISIESLKTVCEKIKISNLPVSKNHPSSPGQSKSHYAPRTKLYAGNMKGMLRRFANNRKALLSFSEKHEGENIIAEEILSASCDLHEAARNLFTAMRKLDACGADVILAERLPAEGLGLAINDRLDRASA